SFIESWLLSMTPIKKPLLRMLKKSKPQENGVLQRQIGGEEKGGMPGSIVARITTTLSFLGIVVTVILQGMVVLCKYPLSLKLERDFPHGDQMKLPELRDRDILRHCKFVRRSSTEIVIDFQLRGTYDPYRFIMQKSNWGLLRRNITYNSIMEVMYYGSIAKIAKTKRVPLEMNLVTQAVVNITGAFTLSNTEMAVQL
nr:aspartic proteinase-like protein 2 [Tanacetum cinerariifolium]